ILHELALHELRDDRPARALDVHRAARDEMPDALPALRGTRWVRAVVRDFALGMLDRAAADRTRRRHVESRVVLRPVARVDVDADDLRDHVAGALDDDTVALAHVE